jgi:hypothetical protein
MTDKTIRTWRFISWEPELFISGGLILTLLNAQPLLNQLRVLLMPYSLMGTSAFLAIFSDVLGGLTFGFITHLVLRALWLMKMGMASAIGKPFEPEKFKFKSVFQSRIQAFDMRVSAEKLGNLASLVFSITFFMLLVSLGFMVLLFTLMITIGIIHEVLAFVLLLLLFVDFISFGSLKRTQIGAVLSPVLRIMYFCSLSFLYRDMYYYLLQHVRRRYLFFGFSIFMLASIAIGYASIADILHLRGFSSDPVVEETYYRNLYDDERDDFAIRFGYIPSYIHEGGLLKLFVLQSESVDLGIQGNSLQVRLDHEATTPLKIRSYRGTEGQQGYMFFLDVSALGVNQEHAVSVWIDGEKKVDIPYFISQ